MIFDDGFVELIQSPMLATSCHCHGPSIALGQGRAPERRLRLDSRGYWPVCVTAGDVSSGASSRQPEATFSFSRQCTGTPVSVNQGTEAKFPEPGTPGAPAIYSTVVCEPQGQPQKTV